LQKVRNCKGQQSGQQILLSKDLAFDRCPINAMNDRDCSEIYSIVKSTLLSEMGAFLPSQFLDELNIYFVYKNTILKAESDFESNKGTK